MNQNSIFRLKNKPFSPDPLQSIFTCAALQQQHHIKLEPLASSWVCGTLTDDEVSGVLRAVLPFIGKTIEGYIAAYLITSKYEVLVLLYSHSAALSRRYILLTAEASFFAPYPHDISALLARYSNGKISTVAIEIDQLFPAPLVYSEEDIAHLIPTQAAPNTPNQTPTAPPNV